MDIRLAESLITTDSIVDGPNLRTVIWTQGCRHNCPGCHNLSTHSFDGGFKVDADEVVEIAIIQRNAVTFSGGDPMEQADACGYIAKKLKEQGVNIWCYTGYTYEHILTDKHMSHFLKYIDVLVDGRFILQQSDLTLKFRGSGNQRIIDVQKSLQEGKVVLLGCNNE